MHLHQQNRKRLIAPLALFVMISGCDDRVAQVAREASDRQAAQNRQMAELQQEVARGTHELVKADAATRQEVVAVHRDLQHERRQLSESWGDLEVERRRIDDERRSDSSRSGFIAAILGAMLLITYFGFLWQLVARAGSNEPSQEELSELLLEHFLPAGPSECRAPVESRLQEGRGPCLAVLTTDGSSNQDLIPPK